MIAKLLQVTDAAIGAALPVTTRHLFATLQGGQPVVHTGGGNFTPVANDLTGRWVYQRLRGEVAAVRTTLAGDPCDALQVTVPLRVVALLDRDTCIDDGTRVATAIKGITRDAETATDAFSVQVERVTWSFDALAAQEFTPLPAIPTHRTLLVVDAIIVVRGRTACLSDCAPVDVTCAIIAAATLEKIRECLGDRIAELCDTPVEPCDPFVIEWQGTPILTFTDPCGDVANLDCDTPVIAAVRVDTGDVFHPVGQTDDGRWIFQTGVQTLYWEDGAWYWDDDIDTTTAPSDAQFPWDAPFSDFTPPGEIRQATIADVCCTEPEPCDPATVKIAGIEFAQLGCGEEVDIPCPEILNGLFFPQEFPPGLGLSGRWIPWTDPIDTDLSAPQIPGSPVWVNLEMNRVLYAYQEDQPGTYRWIIDTFTPPQVGAFELFTVISGPFTSVPWDPSIEWTPIEIEFEPPLIINPICPCPAPEPCDPLTLTFDGLEFDTVEEPCGAEKDIDCNTLLNAAYAVDGGAVTGTYKVDGTLNARETFRKDGTHNFEYTGTNWRLVRPGSDYNAAPGVEAKPWQADWSATPVTVSQATIGAYCDDCPPPEPCPELCDLLGEVAPADVVAEVYDCLTEAAQDELLDSVCPVPPTLCDQLGLVAPGDAKTAVWDCLTTDTQYNIALPSFVDRDAAAYLARVEQADGQLLEWEVRKLITEFVVGAKAAGVWDAIKASCIMAGARTLAGALVPLKGPSPQNVNFVGADYTRKTGLIGNGVDKYLVTNRNNNADPQNNQSVGVWIETAGGAGHIYMGAGTTDSGTTNLNRRPVPNDANIATRSQSGTADTSLAVGTATGYMGISRSGSTGYNVRVNGADNAITQASQTPLDRMMLVYASMGPTIPFGWSDARLKFYHQGEALTQSTLEGLLSTLYTGFNAVIP